MSDDEYLTEEDETGMMRMAYDGEDKSAKTTKRKRSSMYLRKQLPILKIVLLLSFFVVEDRF